MRKHLARINRGTHLRDHSLLHSPIFIFYNPPH
jgi:hypothetical protein